MDFENKLKIGFGVYTASEISKILRLPYQKVNYWINRYWDGELGKEFEDQYSWETENSRAVSFHTLIEFYVLVELAERGVRTRTVLEAHKKLSKIYNTAFPFARKEVLSGLKTDGKHIFIKTEEGILSLDGSNQFNIDFIKIFFKNLEFSSENLATRFWPMGKNNSILIDPERKFGHPVIESHNIYPETIHNHHKAGDPIKYLAYSYGLSEKQVQDALEYCQAA